MAKLSALLIGDPHFKVTNSRETEAFTERIYKIIDERKPTFAVNLGDTFDTHERLHVAVLNRGIKFIKKLSKCTPTFVLIGNHDRVNNQVFLDNVSPFVGLEDYKNIYIITEPKLFNIDINGIVVDITRKKSNKLDNLTENKVNTLSDFNIIENKSNNLSENKGNNPNNKSKNFLFVPYVAPGRFIEAINTLDLDIKDVDCILAHQEFDGLKFGGNTVSMGDKWPLEYPQIFSGHIHEYIELQKNIIYTGAPLAHAYGENTLMHSLSYIHYDSDEFNQLIHERIPLNVCRRITLYTDVNNMHKVKIPTEDKDAELPPLVRVVIRGDGSELKNITVAKQITEWRKSGVKIDYKASKSDSTPPEENIVHRPYLERLMEALNTKQKLLLKEIL